MKSNDFDKIASVYDALARLVFGRSIVDAQKHFLHCIPRNARVLIVGGGTGWIIRELLAQHPDARIWFVDASEKMIASARKKTTRPDILFIKGTEHDIPEETFDIVITNFYLDLFPTDKLEAIGRRIRHALKPRGIWMIADFLDDKPWMRWMLKLMFVFFRVTTNIESRGLPDWNKAMNDLGGKKKDGKYFYYGFIEAALFQF